MRRRDILTTMAGATVCLGSPLAHAQQPDRVRRVGVLMAVTQGDPEGEARLAALRGGLEELGWVDGANLRLDMRWAAGDRERIRQYVAELVGEAPDIIVGNGTAVLDELHKATRSIPVVFVLTTDPVGLGYIDSLAHPGGNITGFTFLEPSLVGKWLQLLHEVAPNVTRAVVIFNPQSTPYYYSFLKPFEGRTDPSGIEIIKGEIATLADVQRVVASIASEPHGSLIVPGDPFNIVHDREILAEANRFNLPTLSVYRQFVLDGGLLSYAPSTVDVFRRSAAYIDRILKGANPGELPAQSPVTYELVINLKAAKALQLGIPLNLLARADEVIE
ncbi:MAG: ABC transporter substrate-binding protein [Hyphomicrobiales bacterium]